MRNLSNSIHFISIQIKKLQKVLDKKFRLLKKMKTKSKYNFINRINPVNNN